MATITVPAKLTNNPFTVLLRQEPALVLFAGNAAVALSLAWGWHLTEHQVGSITVIATALFTVIAAFLARPVATAIIPGAVTTVITALTAFSLHLPPAAIGTTVAILSTLLSLLFRANMSPVYPVTPPAPVPAAKP